MKNLVRPGVADQIIFTTPRILKLANKASSTSTRH